jgi:hypothetical protein
MQKSFLFIVMSIYASVALQCQQNYNSDQIIAFDLLDANGPFPANFDIKKNVRIRYSISNINRNVYNVSVNSESRSMFVEKPTIFGIISDIDLSKLSPSLPAEAAGLGGTPLGELTAVSLNNERAIITSYTTSKSNVNNSIQNYNTNDAKIKKLSALYRSLGAMLLDGISPFNTLLTAKQNLTNRILSSDFAYTGQANDEQALLAHLRTTADNLFDVQIREYSTLMLRYNILKQNFILLEQLFNSKTQELKKRLAVAKSADKQGIQVQIDDIATELVIEKLIIDGITEVVNDIKLIHSRIIEYNQSGFTQSLALVYQRISLANWQYISPSILGNQDEVTVKVSIEPKEGTVPTPNYAMFNGEVKGSVYGFKLNFSTGVFVLASKKLIDKSYRIDTIAGDIHNNIVVENKTRESIQPAVGALMHFYNKQPGSFSWGGNIGFSVSNQTKLNYHGGVSFLLGDEQRIIGSLGIAVSQVKVITSAYETSQKISRSSGINTISTENFYRAGFFVAITFNLSN